MKPKVGVVFDEDNNVLLLEHIFHRPISWGLPGGWLDRGESPEDALRREIFEETGLKVKIEQMLIFEPSTDPKQLQISYLCKHTGDQTFRLSNEIASAKWFATSSTPSKLLSFHRRSIQAGLRATRSDSAQSNHSLNFNG